jgi:translation initiation factor 2B subunit (eIF-2B alpha/beta/delta family)
MGKLLSNIKRQEHISGHKQKIIESIESKDVDQLVSALKDTNMALTCFEQGHFSPGVGIKELKKELTELFQEADMWGNARVVAYLGDGGLSRMIIGLEEGGNAIVDLTHNSTDEVKEAWKKLQ